MAEHNQRFDSHRQWITFASRWLTRHPEYDERFFRAICFDSDGRICRNGGDFKRADNEKTFPIYWIWPDQNLFRHLASILKEGETNHEKI